MYVQLYGSATDVNVRLDKSSIMLDNTFIGLSSQRYSAHVSYYLIHYHAIVMHCTLQDSDHSQQKQCGRALCMENIFQC